MILYFVDRNFNVLGHSVNNKDGFGISNDERVIDILTNVETFSFDILYSNETRDTAEQIANVGNYILRYNVEDNKQTCYTIIDSKQDLESMSINIYSEDTGLDLINDIVGPFNTEKADLDSSVNYAENPSLTPYEGYISATGEFVSHSAFRTSGYVSISQNVDAFLISVSKPMEVVKRFGAAFYDSNHNFTGGPGAYLYVYDTSQVSRLEVPNNSAYIRFTFHVDFDDTRVAESTVRNYSIQEYVNNCVNNSGFAIGINTLKDVKKAIEFNDPQTSQERLLEIMSYYEAEMSFRYLFDGFKITNKYVDIYKKRDSDKGVQLRFGKEVKNVIITRSVADLATAVRAYGVVSDSEGDLYFTLKNYGGTIEEGYYIEDELLCSKKAYQKWSRYLTSREKNSHIIKEFEHECSSQQTLYENALEYLKSIEEPSVSYEVELLYLPKDVVIGDTIHIIDEEKTYITSRVMSIRKSEYSDSITIELGDYSSNHISQYSGGSSGRASGGGSSSEGSSNYESLINKPSINSVILVGNKTSSDLSLISSSNIITNTDIDSIVSGG